MIVLTILLLFTHYIFTNAYEKALFQQVFEDRTRRPKEQCSLSTSLSCQGMPSGHVEVTTIIVLMIAALYFESKPMALILCAFLIVMMAIQRVLYKWHTLLQTIVGFLFGLCYAVMYVHTPMLYLFWLFPLIYLIVLVCIVERRIRTEPLPNWVSEKAYQIVKKKMDGIGFLSKMQLASLIAFSQQHTLYLTWANLEKHLDKIVTRFEKHDVDIIIGVKSGGAIISDYISKRLGVKNYYMKMATMCEKTVAESMMEFFKKYVQKVKVDYKVCEDVPIDITGKRVLLIDESVGTGGTLRACRKYLLEKGAKSVNLACVENWKKSRLTNSELFVAVPSQYFVIWPWGYDN